MAVQFYTFEDGLERTQRIAIEARFPLNGRRETVKSQSIELGF